MPKKKMKVPVLDIPPNATLRQIYAAAKKAGVDIPHPPRGRRKEKLYLDVPPNATLKQIYAAHAKQFTAADLQKYTIEEKGIPARKVLAELEEIHRRFEAKKNKKGS